LEIQALHLWFLFMGDGVGGWMWDKQIKHFTNFHCLVPDLLEQGKNRNKDHFSVNFSAEKIIELIEKKRTR